ncbi:translocation/assembly module TamB domain-containing protein [candidate division KSB1 bacterium]|nr:translocation/assembly module TamB domain-containing protein [candidate division KSB1 bacterium]RQW03370.1 MAG: translocation/assembly module TamB [candidate division KSB1 bacterium]
MRRMAKIILITLVIFILALLSLPLVIQTRPFKNWLAGFVEKSVNKSLNAELSIGRIDGNFFSRLALSDLALTFDQDTLAAIPSLELHYNLKSVLKKKVVISAITIDSPTFFVYQLPDSSWIFDHLVEAASEPADQEAKAPADSSAFNWTIDLDQLALKNLSARIAAKDSLIPRHVRLAMQLSGRMAPDAKTLHLQDMSVQTSAPEFNLSSMTLSLEQTRQGLSLNNFAIRTAKNALTGSAGLDGTAPLGANAAIRTNPLDLSEFRSLLPSIHIKGQPRLEVTGQLQDDQLQAALGLKSAQSGIDVRASVGNFSHLLGDSTQAEPFYDITATVANVSLADWLPDIDQSIVINGVLSAKGSGISAATAKADIDVQLRQCELEGRMVERLTLASSYNRGSIQAKLDLMSDMGDVNVVARVRDVTSRQIYDLALNGSNLDLAAIAQDSSLVSDLNFCLTANGSSFSPQDMIADGALRLQPSRIQGIEMDTIDAVVHLADQDITITSMQVRSSGVHAEANGTLSLDSTSDLSITVQADDMTSLNQFIGAGIGGRASVSAHLNGKPDSLLLTGAIEANSLAYGTQTIDSLHVDFNAQRVREELAAAAHATINNINVGNVLVHDVDLQADLTPERIEIRTSLQQGDDIRARLHAQYYLYDLPIIYIKSLEVDLRDRQWRGGSEETSILLGDGEYIVTNFLIESIDSDTAKAQIYLDGTVRLQGEEDLQLRVRNFRLAPFAEFLKDHPTLDGQVNLDIILAGEADQPLLDIETNIADMTVNQIVIKTLKGSIAYDREQIKADILLIPRTNDLTVRGTIPAHFSLSEPSFRLFDDKPLNIAVKAESIPLANLYAPREFIDDIAGTLSLDVHVGNTLSDIAPGGVISIDNGRIRNDAFGIQLDDLDLKVVIKSDSLILQQLRAAQGNGWISMNGFAALDSNLLAMTLKAIRLNINADNFYLSRKPEHEIQIDANMGMNGPLDALRFAGNLEIIRSSFYLPALTGQSSQIKSRATPLLIKALAAETDTLAVDTTVTVAAKKEASPLLKNMRGALKVKIPRNTWFKSDNMHVEIGGDVEVIKNSELFELFGSIVILRGQYDFLARRFKVDEGTVSFQGGETINPILDVTAAYTFRDSNKAKRTIYLVVTNKAMNPDIAFKLDDDNITEGEAVAYILFNRSPDEMNRQMETTSQPKSYMASDLLYGMMSAELSKRLGRQLGVDYLEIKGKDNLNTATFIVGKYITPDLFMSYEHSIGALEEDRPPQIVTVEYQLTKYLFFQLISGDTKSTGADIILKFDR